MKISTSAANRAQIVSFTGDPRQIIAGQSATLTWRTLNADVVNISGIGNVAASSSMSVSPTTTTTYTLTARNSVNQDTQSVTIVVASSPAQVLVFGCTATPASISAGQSSTLAWTSMNANNVVITPGVGAVDKTGTVQVKPSQTTTYTVTARAGSSMSSCNVTVTVAATPVIASFTAAPATITAGQSSTLTWSVQNADSVSISSIGTVLASGTKSVSPTVTTTYTLTATNKAGSTTRTATVTVSGGTTGPTIVFATGDIIYTTSRDVQLDASGSFSPSGNNPLSFYWTVRGDDRAVDYQRTSSTPHVYLRQDPGNYIFDLTVTDSKGNSSTKTLTVRLIGL